MIDVIVHYISGGEGLASSIARDHPARKSEFARVPISGELIASYDGKSVELVVQIVHSRDGSVHAFVEPAFPPSYVAAVFCSDG